MADGMWTMTDEGEFILSDDYAKMLEEARAAATQGWVQGIVTYLLPRCQYTVEELRDALIARATEDMDAQDIVQEFVLEALSGDL